MLLILNYLDGATHWSAVKEASKQPARWYPPYSQSNSLNIEATSYALMTYVLNKEIAAATPIAKWLSMQRNSQGGFSSTQVYQLLLYCARFYILTLRIPIKYLCDDEISCSNK